MEGWGQVFYFNLGVIFYKNASLQTWTAKTIENSWYLLLATAVVKHHKKEVDGQIILKLRLDASNSKNYKAKDIGDSNVYTKK